MNRMDGIPQGTIIGWAGCSIFLALSHQISPNLPVRSSLMRYRDTHSYRERTHALGPGSPKSRADYDRLTAECRDDCGKGESAYRKWSRSSRFYFALGKAQTRKSGRGNWVLAAEGPETFDWREAEDYLWTINALM